MPTPANFTLADLAAERGLSAPAAAHLAALATESAGTALPATIGVEGVVIVPAGSAPATATTTITNTRASITTRSHLSVHSPPSRWPLALILPDPLLDEPTSLRVAAEVTRALERRGQPGRLSSAGDRAVGDVNASIRGDTALWLSSVSGAKPIDDAVEEARTTAGPHTARALSVFLPAAVDALTAGGILSPAVASGLEVSVQATLYAAGSAGYGRHIDHGRAATVSSRVASAALYLGPRVRPPGMGGELLVWPATSVSAAAAVRRSAAGTKRRRSSPPSTSGPAVGPCLSIVPAGGRAVAWDAHMHHAVAPVSANTPPGAPPRLAISVFFNKKRGSEG